MSNSTFKLELEPLDGPTVVNPRTLPPQGATSKPAPAPEMELAPEASYTPPAKTATPTMQEVDIVANYPSGAAPDPNADPARADKFYKEAHAQYVEGHIDQPLWTRALAQVDGDKDRAIPIYLKSRATALRLLDRNLRTKDRATHQAEDRARAPRARSGDDPVVEEGDAPAPVAPGYDKRRVAILVGLVAVLGIAVAAFFGMRTGDKPAAVPAAAAAKAAAKAAQLEKEDQEKKAAAVAEREAAEKAQFMAKMAELIETKNWNVLVLYSTEWTRREPSNPAAWSQLSIGYNNLKQYGDAMQAAQQAVKLSPKDAALWRTLGQVTMNANRAEEALVAFEGATALDERDVESFVQSGILQARLGQFPEAQRSIDRALAIVPSDPQAQCLKAAIAAKARAPKDASAAPPKAAGTESVCAELIEPPKSKTVVVESKPQAPGKAPRR